MLYGFIFNSVLFFQYDIVRLMHPRALVVLLNEQQIPWVSITQHRCWLATCYGGLVDWEAGACHIAHRVLLLLISR